MMRDDEFGSLEIGKYADFIVLDRSPLEAAPDELGAIMVDRTVFEGEIVYERGD